MAKQRYVLAIDQGTTGTHVSVIDDKVRVVGRAYREFRQHFPHPGWVEHDLEEIFASVQGCISKALKDAGIKGKRISAIGITNQRETTGLWERETGRPLGRAIVWQDRRTADACTALIAQGHQERIQRTTGLVLDPYFSATKLQWLLEHHKKARKRADAGELCFGTIDTWLVHQLTGQSAHVTDASNASRTLLMNLSTLSWDHGLCELFGVPAVLLPRIGASAEIYGETKGLKSLPDGIPISGMAGDQQSALFGQACFDPGESKCTYGTGAFLLMNVGNTPVFSKHGLLSTVGWKIKDKVTYALEGSSFIAGAAVQWLRDGLKLIRKSSDIEKLALTVGSTGAVVFVPALAGLGAPHWKPNARGVFAGMDRSTTSAHLARAVLEGMALQIHELANAMRKDSGRDIPSFKVDGGAAANNLLMQCQADLLGTEVVRPRNLETTSLGAAFLGGLGAGIWQTPEEIRRAIKVEKRFKPRMSSQERTRMLEKWARAVACA